MNTNSWSGLTQASCQTSFWLGRTTRLFSRTTITITSIPTSSATTRLLSQGPGLSTSFPSLRFLLNLWVSKRHLRSFTPHPNSLSSNMKLTPGGLIFRRIILMVKIFWKHCLLKDRLLKKEALTYY